MKRSLSHALFGACIATVLSAYSLRADTFGFTEAFDNSTIQPAGPRTGTGSTNFFNIEGTDNGSFSSYGVADYTVSPLGSVTISQITLRFTESNGSFSHSGGLNFWLTADLSSSLHTGSTLAFDAGSPPDGIGANFGSLYFLGSGTFDYVDATSNPNGTVDTYIFSPDVGNEDAFTLLTSIASSGGTVRAIISPDNTDTAATWAGFSNSTYSGPEISFEYTAIPEPQTYALVLAGLGTVLMSVRNRRRIF